MEMQIRFPEAMRVDAEFKGVTIGTDQPAGAGGQASAPAPFDLFLASLGTCAGYYALRFLQQRGLSTDGLSLTMTTEKDSETRMISGVVFHLQLPDDFPPRYLRAIERAVDQCTVKKHLLHPPRFETAVSIRTGALA